MRAKKILHIFPDFSMGGQQSRLCTLMEHWQGLVEHHILSLSGGLDAVSQLPAGIKATAEAMVLTKSGGLSFSNIRQLRAKFKEIAPDFICTYNWGAMEAVIANRIFPIAPSVHFEDGFGPEETPQRQIGRRVLTRRLFLRHIDTIVPSQALQRVALDRWKLPGGRVQYVTNGIEIEKFSCERTYDATQEALIGTIGALRPEKNYTRLINCFSAHLEGVSSKLIIWGDGPELRPLIERANQTAPERIQLAGRTMDAAGALREMDVFALSSDTEQMPISLMEAMAAGLPVVATDVGDVKAMVSEENRPFIVPVSDERKFGEALSTVCKNQDLRRKLGMANARRAKECFSVTAMAGAHQKIYDAAIARYATF